MKSWLRAKIGAMLPAGLQMFAPFYILLYQAEAESA